jgi:hypothetical protein
MEKQSEKIYNDDPNVPYKSTELAPKQSRMEIEGILAKYGIKDTAWRWDPENNEIFVGFSILEDIAGQAVSSYVKVYAPLIWKHHKAGHQKEEVDWRISLRVMFWFIKSSLEVSFLWHIKRSAAFLPFLRNTADQPMAEVLISRLKDLQVMPALAPPAEKPIKNITHEEN